MKFTYKENAKERLDKFLSSQLPDISRSQIKKAILDQQVTVNNENSSVHRWLKPGDIIDFAKAKVKIKSPDKMLAPKIIDQTKDYLVIDKPSGLLVHPTDKGETNTLADWLIANFPKIKKVGDDQTRPGIMHRLDKEASGLMVIALNQASFDSLKKQFQARKVIKEYTALISGHMQEESGEITTPLERDKKTGLMKAQTALSTGKTACTIYEVLTPYLNYTLLKLKIITGRQHQIRAHLYSIGHSIVGDKLYITKDLRKKIAQRATRTNQRKTIDDLRLFLHSSFLKFKDQQNQWQEYKSALPKNLKDFLTTIK